MGYFDIDKHVKRKRNSEKLFGIKKDNRTQEFVSTKEIKTVNTENEVRSNKKCKTISDIKQHLKDDPKKHKCDICGREARVKRDEKYYCWAH